MTTRPMTPSLPLTVLAFTLLLTFPAGATEEASATPAPTVADQMAGLETMCAATADARAARHAAAPLWDRLGGRDKVRAFVDDVIARHRDNPAIAHFMDGVDDDRLAGHLVDFISVGTGGGGEYGGRSLEEVHRPMKMTDADFLAAGGDIVAAMQGQDYGQEEIDEFVCVLVSLKPAVVFE